MGAALSSRAGWQALGVSGHQCDADGADDHYSAESPFPGKANRARMPGGKPAPAASADPETIFRISRRKEVLVTFLLLLWSRPPVY